jgi:hypothetical protein
MSLLLQLLDRYRHFKVEDLDKVMTQLDPRDIDSNCSMLEHPLLVLPDTATVILIVDVLRWFSQPADRQEDLVRGFECLVYIYRKINNANLKFLFANSTRSEYVEEFFTDDELPKILRALIGRHGYNLTNLMGTLQRENDTVFYHYTKKRPYSISNTICNNPSHDSHNLVVFYPLH